MTRGLSHLFSTYQLVDSYSWWNYCDVINRSYCHQCHICKVALGNLRTKWSFSYVSMGKSGGRPPPRMGSHFGEIILQYVTLNLSREGWRKSHWAGMPRTPMDSWILSPGPPFPVADRCIFIVRRINKLGFRSKTALESRATQKSHDWVALFRHEMWVVFRCLSLRSLFQIWQGQGMFWVPFGCPGILGIPAGAVSLNLFPTYSWLKWKPWDLKTQTYLQNQAKV